VLLFLLAAVDLRLLLLFDEDECLFLLSLLPEEADEDGRETSLAW